MGKSPTMALALLLALALTSIFAACNGGDDDNGGDGNGDATAAPTGTVGAGDETPDGTAPPDASPTSTANPDDLATLEDVRDLFIGSTFTATYENRGQTDVEFVPVRIYKDGEQRYRVDFVGQREGQPYSGVSIIDEGSAYICGTGELARLIGGNEAGACVRDPGGTGNPIEALFSAFSADPNLRILERSERQVAGRTARCYTTEHTASGERGTLCQDAAGGALLAIESADPAGTNIVATDVSDGVNDADFAPPYEVRELPGSGQ
jgi:hypothetical protein